MNHPRDEWFDVTALGGEPQFLLAVDGREVEIAEAREMYVHDRISLDDFERCVEGALA